MISLIINSGVTQAERGQIHAAQRWAGRVCSEALEHFR